MSFVQRLRMANMFPIHSDLGSASIDMGGSDPMMDVIEAGKALHEWARPNGLQQIGRMQRGAPLPGSGDFSDMFRNSLSSLQGNNQVVNNAQASPLPPFEPGIRPGAENNLVNKDANGELDIDKNLARANIRSQINERGERTDIAAENAHKNDMKVVKITDPNDPTKQIDANYDDRTGTVTPIKLPNGQGGTTVQPGESAKTNQAEKDKAQAKIDARKAIVDQSKDALSVLNTMIDEKGNLTPDMQWITGKTGMFGLSKNTPEGQKAAGKVAQLKNKLTLDYVQKLKDAKTGHNLFPRMTNLDLKVLQDAVSQLDYTGQPDVDYAAQLKGIRDKLNNTLADDSDSSDFSNNSGNSTNKTAPKAPAGYEYVRRPDNRGWVAKKLGGK